MMTCVALGLAAQEVAPPHAGEALKVAAHSSKWEYPTEVVLPADSQLYLVQKGDTLWDLGNKFLSNPYAWPKIWEQNKWVKDPHWIYPGDPLVIPSTQVVAKAGDMPTAADDILNLQPDRGRFNLKPTAPEWGYSFQDFIQLPYLVPSAEAHFSSIKALKVVDSDNPVRQNLGDGDRIYLDGGQDKGVKEGTRFVILKVAAKKISHPSDPNGWHPIGDVIQQAGVVRVIRSNPKGSVAVIEKSMDGIEVGDRLAEYTEPASIPLSLRKDISEPIPTANKVAAKVIYSRENHESFAGGDLVIIDKGTKDGLVVGNVLLSIREVTWDVTSGKTEAKEKTNRYLGQMMVVREGENYSTCRVLRSSEEMHVGDIVIR